MGGGALTDAFRWLDTSADGTLVVAVSHNGNVYRSTDGGATFAPLPVTVGGAAVADGWYRVAMSDDGNRIAVVGSTEYGGGIIGANCLPHRGAGPAGPAVDRWRPVVQPA